MAQQNAVRTESKPERNFFRRNKPAPPANLVLPRPVKVPPPPSPAPAK